MVGVGVETGCALTDGKYPIAAESAIVPSLAEAVALFTETAPSWDAFVGARARIIAIGGPSRAGKTVCANALRLHLSARGIEVVHVSLDRFLVPAAERAPSVRLRERSRFSQAAEAVRRLAAGESVALPGYDPRRRVAAPGRIVTVGEGVLIVDGLLASALEAPGVVTVAVHAPEAARLARRRRFYAWKGLSGPPLERAVRPDEEEVAEVARAVERAQLHLHLDERLRLKEGRGP
jgi:hypothetical protein